MQSLKTYSLQLCLLGLALTLTNGAGAEVQSTTPIVTPASTSSFLEDFPKLKDYVYREPQSGFYFGFGLSPVGVLKDRMTLNANIFQVHWMSDRYNYEVLNISYGVTRAQSKAYESNNFTFRTSFKIRIGEIFSFGPLVGYEFVSFPNLYATILKSPYQTPEPEPFSSRGLIYGGILSQTFKYKKDYLIQVSEMAYQQTYSTTETPEGWDYNYVDRSVQNKHALIEAGLVMMIEASFLF